MILERTRELVINLGNNTYESARIAAKISFDPAELDEGVDPFKWADDQLSILLAAEVKYWHEITTKRDSFIHLVHQDNIERETKNG
jgi:hypothetical protein